MRARLREFEGIRLPTMTESYAQLFEESLASQRIRPGQILTGRVIEVDGGSTF